jgi:hypothetical protein
MSSVSGWAGDEIQKVLMRRFRGARHVVGLAAMSCVACSIQDPWDEIPWDAGDFDDPAGVLSGVTVDGDLSPVAGVRLTTDPHGYEAITDTQGRFAISRLPAGTYRLVAAADSFEVESAPGIVVTAGTEIDVEVQLAPVSTSQGEIEVLVEGPDGLPLASAVVSDSTGQTVYTDGAGVAVLTGLGGQVVDLAVAEVDEALWGRTLDQVEVASRAVVRVSVRLAGKAPPDATYIGTDFCVACHPDHAEDQDLSPHGRAMAAMVGEPFLSEFTGGSTVDLAHGTAVLGMQDTTPVVTLTSDGGDSREFTVAGVIGDVRSGGIPWTELDDQAYPLPIAWAAADPDFGDWPETESALLPWEEENWIDANGDFIFSDGNRPTSALSADARCFPCHATGFTLTERPDGGVDLAGPSGRWRDGFVGCERCHGPGSAHASSTLGEKKFRITQPQLLDVDRSNEVCGQCHGMTQGVGNALPYPFKSGEGFYRPGELLADYGAPMADLWAIGAAAAPSAQADELAVGPHSGGSYTLGCGDCHDPHGSGRDGHGDPLPHLLRLDDRDNTLCLSCHQRLHFQGDSEVVEAHPRHFTYDPAGPSQGGRCARCHMPRTAARLAFHPGSGAGDLSSHLFAPIPPQEAVDVFVAEGVDLLPVGSFPIHSCAECHAYNHWLAAQDGLLFPGPHADPSRLQTQQAFQGSYLGKFP